MSLVDLLREPDRTIAALRMPDAQRALAAQCLVAILVGGALFGAAMGSFRGGSQIVVAALKIPAATLLTMAFSGPALLSLAAAFDRRWRASEALALMLAAGARSCLVLGALAPVLWLGIDLGLPYGALKLTATGAYGLAGLSGLSVLLRGLGKATGRTAAASCFAMVFLVVGAQTAWILRPYVGDPSDEEIPMFAHGRVEGGLFGSLRGRGWR